MIKEFLRTSIRKLGYDLISADRFGVHMEADLARFVARQPLQTIFDVGGNSGQTALRFSAMFPDADIYSFEPVPTTFAHFIQTTKHNQRIKPFNLALGDTEGAAKINLTPSARNNSLLQNGATIDAVDVQVTTIDSFASTKQIDKIDLLKIDVEGYELQVLRGANHFLKERKIRYIFAECVFAPDTLFPHTSFFDLHQLLDANGFRFVNYYPESFSLRIGCAMGNVLYAMQSTLPEQVSGSIRNVV